MQELLQKLEYDKIQINWNKNPIKMDLFLSFLTIDVTRSYGHLGSDMGWSQLRNDEHKLIIRGGSLRDGEYLDSIQYGEKLHNKFNNWVNPFYLFHIMTQEGKDFFLNYYKEEIKEVIQNQKNTISILKNRLKSEKEALNTLENAFKELKK